ncbi:MAG: hypothetical protein ACJ75T_01815 [Solirubrobacterales bacterium]
MSLRPALAAFAMLLLVALPPAAQAAYDPVGGGTTRLVLDPSFLGLLHRSGATLGAVAPARLSHGTVSFPVSGGKLDPTTSNGTLRHEGALVIAHGRRRIPIKALQLKTSAGRSPFSAKVGGSQLKLGSGATTTVARRGFGIGIEVDSLALSRTLATRLGKKLRLPGVLEAGQALARSATSASPQTVTLLPEGATTLSFDPGFEAKLRSLFVAVNPIFPAEHPGAFTLPIGGGKLSPLGTEGYAQTEGSLEFLQLGGGQLFWGESRFDLGAQSASAEVNAQPSPPYAGKVGRIPFASLGAGAFEAVARSRQLSLTGAPLTLDPGMAATFNQLFAEPQGKKDVFHGGEAVGTTSFAARGQ